MTIRERAVETVDKHTPGPWEISKSGKMPIYVAAKDGRWKDAPGTIIGTVGTISHGTGDFREDIANARLIAAAPDMLAALCEIRKHAADYQRGQIASVAAAAIARATGREG